MGRRRKHDDQVGAVLLDAAEELLHGQGIDGLSVRAVAERTGTTTRAVYTVFGSKAGLLAALGERAFNLLGTGVAAMPETGDPAADLVETTLRVYRRFALNHPALFRLAIQWEATPPDVAEQFRPAADAAGVLYKQRVARLNADPIVDAAYAVNALCEGLASMELRCGFPDDAGERLWRDSMTALVAGLSAAGAKD